MKAQSASRLAWSIGIISIALMLGQLVVMFIDRNLTLPNTTVTASSVWNFADVLNALVNIAATGFGILLASRQPRNPIGWLFLAAGFALGFSGFGAVYALHALVADPGSLPAGRAAAWVSNWTGLIPLGVLCFLFILFPTGHLRSARWRGAAWFVGGAFTLATAFFLAFSTMTWNDPYSQSSSSGSSGISWWVLLPLLIVSALVVSLAAVVVRFRGSSGEERLQLKWFATGAAVVVASLIPTFGSSAPVFLVLQSLAFVVLFTAVAVSVLKYRLYDIDVVISKTVVYATLAAFFTAVYVAVVVGLGTAIGSTHDPFLTVAAAAVIAIAFNPVRERAKRLADRLVYGTRATPYEVLSEFSEHMAGTYALDDILPRMARVLAEGTGGRAEIWLRVGDRLRAVSTWPSESASDGHSAERVVVDEDLPEFPGTSKATPVLHRGTLLGAIAVTKAVNDPLRPDEGKLIDDVASQAGLVLFNVRLIEELRASRQRLVKAQDEERRRLERNIHDGAQQQLVALAVKANLAQTMAKRDPDKVEVMLGQLKAEATDALENLRDLARGIYPPLLADKGLAAALESQARKSSVPVSLESDGLERYPQEVEAAVYFCCLEALQNISKYAEASAATIRLADGSGTLAFEVTDDGRGFDPGSTGYGTGLQGMADRLDALGGSLEVRSTPGQGTTVAGRVPQSSDVRLASPRLA
ncbi:MAG: histidine kinase [Actinomycetota bacterium]